MTGRWITASVRRAALLGAPYAGSQGEENTRASEQAVSLSLSFFSAVAEEQWVGASVASHGTRNIVGQEHREEKERERERGREEQLPIHPYHGAIGHTRMVTMLVMPMNKQPEGQTAWTRRSNCRLGFVEQSSRSFRPAWIIVLILICTGVKHVVRPMCQGASSHINSQYQGSTYARQQWRCLALQVYLSRQKGPGLAMIHGGAARAAIPSISARYHDSCTCWIRSNVFTNRAGNRCLFCSVLRSAFVYRQSHDK